MRETLGLRRELGANEALRNVFGPRRARELGVHYFIPTILRRHSHAAA